MNMKVSFLTSIKIWQHLTFKVWPTCMAYNSRKWFPVALKIFLNPN